MTATRKSPKSARKSKGPKPAQRTASKPPSRRKTGSAPGARQTRLTPSSSKGNRASRTKLKPAARSNANQSKSAQVLELLARPDGATLAELMEVTGWQAHSVRGFLSATVRKRMKLPLRSDVPDHARRYWIEKGGQSRSATP